MVDLVTDEIKTNKKNSEQKKEKKRGVPSYTQMKNCWEQKLTLDIEKLRERDKSFKFLTLWEKKKNVWTKTFQDFVLVNSSYLLF